MKIAKLVFFFLSLIAFQSALAASTNVVVTSGFDYGFEDWGYCDKSRLTISVSFDQQTERADYGYTYDIIYYNSSDEVITTLTGQTVAFVGGEIAASSTFNVNEALLPEIRENIQYCYVIYRYTGYVRVTRKSDDEFISQHVYVQSNRVKWYSTGQKYVID